MTQEKPSTKCSPALMLKAADIAYRQAAEGEDPGGTEPDWDLYSGGLGLDLVAASRVASGIGERGDLAMPVFDSWRLLAESAQPPAEAPLGGLIGLGAVAYGLAVVGTLLDDDGLLGAAPKAVKWITDERLAQEPEVDVVHGIAGATLALLAVSELLARRGLGDDANSALERAEACGARLLDIQGPEGGWSNRYGVTLTGFGHGAAGVACALRRLAGRLDDSRSASRIEKGDLLTAAQRAERFERGLYDPAAERWREHAGDPGRDQASDVAGGEAAERSGRGPSTAWCYGGPGIALARLEAVDALEREAEIKGDDAAGSGAAESPAEELRQSLELAVESTVAHPLGDSDHLCCGNLGRAWILQRVSALLQEKESNDLGRRAALRADALAYDTLRFYQRRKRFGVDSLEERSLFKGSAGIALAFMAMADPRRVPFVLDLSPPG